MYVDADPLVLVHARALLTSTAEGHTAYLHGDVRKPADIVERAARTLDFDQPIALMLMAVMHMVPDGDDPHGIVRTLSEALPAGIGDLTFYLRPAKSFPSHGVVDTRPLPGHGQEIFGDGSETFRVERDLHDTSDSKRSISSRIVPRLALQKSGVRISIPKRSARVAASARPVEESNSSYRGTNASPSWRYTA